MPNYIRAKSEGGFYFFTVVTYRRNKLFNSKMARECLRKAINQTREKHHFETIAMCLMPDHLHCIWKLPEGDFDFSTRWASIKGLFSMNFLRKNPQKRTSFARPDKGEIKIWQKRFWEHNIKDESDLQKHLDYIHYNPVKHGLVESAEKWPWSTYHKYIESGEYAKTFYTDLQQDLNNAIGNE